MRTQRVEGAVAGVHCTVIRRSERHRAMSSALVHRVKDHSCRAVGDIEHDRDIGRFQYPSGSEKGVASLQGLDFLTLFGSPTLGSNQGLAD